jgi:hypothetical protein
MARRWDYECEELQLPRCTPALKSFLESYGVPEARACCAVDEMLEYQPPIHLSLASAILTTLPLLDELALISFDLISPVLAEEQVDDMDDILRLGFSHMVSASHPAKMLGRIFGRLSVLNLQLTSRGWEPRIMVDAITTLLQRAHQVRFLKLDSRDVLPCEWQRGEDAYVPCAMCRLVLEVLWVPEF